MKKKYLSPKIEEIGQLFNDVICSSGVEDFDLGKNDLDW